MATQNINPNLIEVALDKVEGFAFESFAQDFLSALEGKNFVPVGGVGDGGADGLFDVGEERYVYQFTRQENHRSKIRKTVSRLKEYGRDVSKLFYLTSRHITHIDSEEDALSDELGVTVKIRDRKYIISHINDSQGAIAAYENHLALYTHFLSSLTRPDHSFSSPHVKNPSAYVFLQHETSNRLGNRKLIHSLADSMIIWALSDTDPDQGIFLNEEEIKQRIFDEFPWSQTILKGQIRPRLRNLRNKAVQEREVRWYRKSDKYCLPHKTRMLIAEENSSDEALQLSVKEELETIASELVDADDSVYDELASLAMKVIHSVFEQQGLVFAHFLNTEDESIHPAIVSDCVDRVLDDNSIPGKKRSDHRDYLETIIRKVFYNGTPNQRLYLSNLSKTYILLFTLQTEPKLIEFFNTMSSSFQLYLGSDIIVKAISERYLEEKDQVARNLLKMASASGVKMYLSEFVLEEVYTHIRATYFEFINYFQEMEKYITTEISRNSEKILIRSYFYAKESGLVSGWKQYLNQFITYENIDSPRGREELKSYLLAEYGLEFVDNSELEAVVNIDRVNGLAEKMLAEDDKENEALAYNTALLVHGIYGLRRQNGETKKASEYGLKTWWITNQTKVLRHTGEILEKESSKFLMRPEFLLNFLAISPSCSEVRESFKNIFPSIFGIQLGHRLDERVFHKIMESVKEWKGYEPGRITAKMSELSDQLKSDRLRRYDSDLDQLIR